MLWACSLAWIGRWTSNPETVGSIPTRSVYFTNAIFKDFYNYVNFMRFLIWVCSLARIGHQTPNLKIGGSNPPKSVLY